MFGNIPSNGVYWRQTKPETLEKEDEMRRAIVIATAVTASLILFLAVPLHSTENGQIKGKVTDAESGSPIAAAAVQLENTTIGALTNQNGEYKIINVPPGTYAIKVTAVGYEEIRITNLTLSAQGRVTQDFKLKAKNMSVDVPMSALSGLLSANVAKVKGGNADEAAVMREQSVASCMKPVPDMCYSAYPMAHGGNTPPNGEPYDAMFFDHYGVNPFVSTEDDHLSTFAIDVDNASYAMTRSYINGGHLPPDDAVRVEEFVNNFDYNYTYPQNDAFAIELEAAPSKFGEHYQMLKVGIVGKKIRPENRKDANLVFVVDVSGSMSREDRLGTVRKSLRMLLDNLNERDRVGIVVYGSRGRVILEPTSIRDREKIAAAIEQLYSEGSTNAEEGIRLGYQMADKMFEKGKINRIILCSDGVANVGRTGADDILKMIKNYADKGITLSTIGFGMGNYNDVLMEKLGDKGNGHYAYVDSWSEAKRVFMENLTGTLQVIARDVKIQVDFDPDKVDRYRLLGYENRDVDDDKFRDDKEDGGEIGSGHQVTALYELKLKDGASGDIGRIYVRFKDPDSFEVTEVSRPINKSIFKSSFAKASTDFKLAAAAAEFSEILRNSYWAKGSKLSDVLDVARTVESERSSDQVIELMDLIAKADKMKQAEEAEDGPLSLEEK
jgi:Ca-activated chloride channel family protein